MERGRKDIHSDALKAQRLLHAVRRQWRKWKYFLWPPRHWDAANIMACLYTPRLVHQIGGGKSSNAKSRQNMHLLQVVANCMFAYEVSLRIRGLGLCTTTVVPPTTHAQLIYRLLGQLIDELMVTLASQMRLWGSYPAPCTTPCTTPRMRTFGRVSSSVARVAMEGCTLGSGPSTLC